VFVCRAWVTIPAALGVVTGEFLVNAQPRLPTHKDVHKKILLPLEFGLEACVLHGSETLFFLSVTGGCLFGCREISRVSCAQLRSQRSSLF
jgi:hypothetical protein